MTREKKIIFFAQEFKIFKISNFFTVNQSDFCNEIPIFGNDKLESEKNCFIIFVLYTMYFHVTFWILWFGEEVLIKIEFTDISKEWMIFKENFQFYIGINSIISFNSSPNYKIQNTTSNYIISTTIII
jgi:hypothetical protein